MIKNLSITNSTEFILNKVNVHNLVKELKNDLNFKIDSVVINLLDADQIIPINNKYLGHNFSTDIITFNYSGENYTLDAEIFISLEDAYFNAEKYEVSISNELLRLIIHGFLHLVGYDDKAKADKAKMKKIENELVAKYINFLTQ